MENGFKTKLPKGRSLVIGNGQMIISKGIEKVIIPINQIKAINCLPWLEDPYLFIECLAGFKVMIEVRPIDKEKIKKMVQEG